MNSLKALSVETLVKLYKAVEPLVEDFSIIDTEGEAARLALTDVLEEILDAGQRKAGSDFVDLLL